MANRTLPTTHMPQVRRICGPGGPGRSAAWLCALAFLLTAVAAPAFADYASGLAAFNSKDYAKAYAEWIDAAKAGEAPAQHGIGMLHDMGQGAPDADAKSAVEWYQKAADQNYAPAINNLARLYADGRGVPADPAKAIALWSRAAEAGNVTARFNLGVQYANGSGVAKDPVKAAEYLKQAAEGGLAEAQFALAGFYHEGLGVAKDPAAARNWYQRAADAGFEPARAAIAAMDQDAAEAAAKAKPAAEQETEAAAKATGQTPPPVPSGAAVPDQSAVDAAGAAETPAKGAPATEAKPEEQVAEVPEADAADEGQAPSEAPEAAAVEAATAPVEQAGEEIAGEGSAAMNSHDNGADLPLAESLTGDALVYRVWLYDTGQEKDASSYWAKLTQKYPGVLKDLKLDLRRYFLGEAKGAIYRVFAGPFDNLAAAQKACEEIKRHFGDQFCRPVIN